MKTQYITEATVYKAIPNVEYERFQIGVNNVTKIWLEKDSILHVEYSNGTHITYIAMPIEVYWSTNIERPKEKLRIRVSDSAHRLIVETLFPYSYDPLKEPRNNSLLIKQQIANALEEGNITIETN